MENKILVEVNVPMIEQTFNIFIPVCKTVGSIKDLLEKSITELSDGAYQKRLDSSIYTSGGKQIDSNLIIKDSGLTNGSKLIII